MVSMQSSDIWIRPASRSLDSPGMQQTIEGNMENNMGIAVVLLGTGLVMTLVTLYDRMRDLKELRGMYVALTMKYETQVRDTTEVFSTLAPLIEQTDWLQPQPYNSGGLAALQAKEAKRNREVVRIRKLFMDMPMVRDHIEGASL